MISTYIIEEKSHSPQIDITVCFLEAFSFVSCRYRFLLLLLCSRKWSNLEKVRTLYEAVAWPSSLLGGHKKPRLNARHTFISLVAKKTRKRTYVLTYYWVDNLYDHTFSSYFRDHWGHHAEHRQIRRQIYRFLLDQHLLAQTREEMCSEKNVVHASSDPNHWLFLTPSFSIDQTPSQSLLKLSENRVWEPL